MNGQPGAGFGGEASGGEVEEEVEEWRSFANDNKVGRLVFLMRLG